MKPRGTSRSFSYTADPAGNLMDRSPMVAPGAMNVARDSMLSGVMTSDSVADVGPTACRGRETQVISFKQ